MEARKRLMELIFPCIQGPLHQGHLPHPRGLSGEQVRPPKGLLSYPKGPEAGRSLQEEEDREGTFLKARKSPPYGQGKDESKLREEDLT